MPSNRIDRRSFILLGSIFTAGAAASVFISKYKGPLSFFKRDIPCKIVGANSSTGHYLRGYDFPPPATSTLQHTVIVGGGVSGLSAARRLHQAGHPFLLLELDEREGGNAAWGQNEVSAYPWGAHYIPVPDPEMKELLTFLEECGTITGYDEAGLPVYNEYHLCADPEERLFINGRWQDGLVPSFGLSSGDKREIESFFALMNQYKGMTGNDGAPAFALPISRCSTDQTFIDLDTVSFASFIKSKGFKSPYLFWYLNYCCRDDYGTPWEQVSAWAGICYFACRKGKAANASYADVLTWPEGNGWLIRQLAKDIQPSIKKNALVYQVQNKDDQVVINYFDPKTKTSHEIIAEKVIMATPQFVNHKILGTTPKRTAMMYEAFSYAPWMVANITIAQAPYESKGRQLSWDNVFINSRSLGYVNACQQGLRPFDKRRVLTYYMPLSDTDPVSARKTAYGMKADEWKELVIDDLSSVHHAIEETISQIDIWLWGHGMIRPVPGFVSGDARGIASHPIDDIIFFAHTDLSGISIFEEGFYQGIRAANELMAKANKL